MESASRHSAASRLIKREGVCAQAVGATLAHPPRCGEGEEPTSANPYSQTAFLEPQTRHRVGKGALPGARRPEMRIVAVIYLSYLERGAS